MLSTQLQTRLRLLPLQRDKQTRNSAVALQIWSQPNAAAAAKVIMRATEHYRKTAV